MIETIKENIVYRRIFLTLFFGILLITSFYFSSFLSDRYLNKKSEIRTDNSYYGNFLPEEQGYYDNITRGDPTKLHEQFLNSVKSGVNNKFTKSDAYYITHRFFDNGGNIYEIYNYIEANPELAFMKEAEGLYPAIFADIKERKLGLVFSDSGFYAVLAYMEILYKNGYTDVSAVATAANQYAGLAYSDTMRARAESKDSKLTKNAEKDIKKSLEFLQIAGPDIRGIISGKLTTEDIVARDILVGVNQYGAAVRYLQTIGVEVQPVVPVSDIFNFAMIFSATNVKELVYFTSLLNAATLAINSLSSSGEIKTAIQPILDFDTKQPNIYKGGVIRKIISSKFEPADSNQDHVYSRISVLKIANKVPEFKSWLIYNGWTEANFK